MRGTGRPKASYPQVDEMGAVGGNDRVSRGDVPVDDAVGVQGCRGGPLSQLR